MDENLFRYYLGEGKTWVKRAPSMDEMQPIDINEIIEDELQIIEDELLNKEEV